MDFRRCYESGCRERRRSLFEDERAYIHGFSRAFDEIEAFAANADDGGISEASPTFARISREIREKTIGDLRRWLRSSWYEMAVSFIEGANGGDNSGKLLQTWRLPEPPTEERVREDDLEYL